MNILAFDLGTKCGWALSPESSGVWCLKPSTHESSGQRYFKFREHLNQIFLFNKIDLVGLNPDIKNDQNGCSCYVSIKKGQGLELLKKHLKDTVGYDSSADDVFLARRRHIEAIRIGHDFVQSALNQLNINNAGELVAEDLRQAQKSLGEITGTVSSDELLGNIFSSFCIGK